MYRIVGVTAALAILVGCSATQLRQKSRHQVRTLADIYQQQVLDNLALFASDFEALPYFAYATQGTASVNDQMALSLTGVLQHQSQQAWQLTPVNDPRKLELMRCVYQRAIAIHRRQPMQGDCPNCARLFNKFYTGDPDVRVDQHDRGGIVTVDCLDAPKWLGIGCVKCAPKRNLSGVGRHHDARVWVLPGGSGELTKLTLAVLDYALHDPPAKSNKTVTFHLTEQGALTTSDKSFAEVNGQVAGDAASDTLVTLPYLTALEHICARNNQGLTVDLLRAIDPATLSEPEGHLEFRSRYQITAEEWREIRGLLIKLKEHQVDSPLHGQPSAASALFQE
jgi:hypothetical protein